MNKNRIINIFCLVLICAVAILAVLPLQRAAKDNSRWMKELEDERMINSLYIPGTHDSGATHSIADLSGKCQSLPISEQLRLGVRFFDIRLQLKDNRLVVVHSFVDQNTDFDDVLRCMADFLKENPSEFLIVSFKEDNDPNNSNVDFTQTLEGMLRGESVVSQETSMPKTVGEARGRLHVVSRYYGSTMGYPAYEGWQDSTSFALGDMYVQDKYQVDTHEEKITEIESAVNIAAEGEHALVLNFTSCYYPDGFPPTYAGAPALKINPWLIDNLPSMNGGCVFLCDFITSELCEAIIGRNFA